jgi:AcrR family transcriptional regulator
MTTNVRKPRHQSRRHRNLTTAQAILVVAEEICATKGATNIRLADIAAELGIESPSIYRYYSGLSGLTAALAAVAIKAEIATFAGLDELPFHEALKLQAERLFDLYVDRPGVARFLMVDLAVPGGLQGFEDDETLALVRELFALERKLLERGITAGALRSMNVTTFVAARLGPAFVAIALRDLQTPGSDVEIDQVKKGYIDTVMALLADA